MADRRVQFFWGHGTQLEREICGKIGGSRVQPTTCRKNDKSGERGTMAQSPRCNGKLAWSG